MILFNVFRVRGSHKRLRLRFDMCIRWLFNRSRIRQKPHIRHHTLTNRLLSIIKFNFWFIPFFLISFAFFFNVLFLIWFWEFWSNLKADCIYSRSHHFIPVIISVYSKFPLHTLNSIRSIILKYIYHSCWLLRIELNKHSSSSSGSGKSELVGKRDPKRNMTRRLLYLESI